MVQKIIIFTILVLFASCSVRQNQSPQTASGTAIVSTGLVDVPQLKQTAVGISVTSTGQIQTPTKNAAELSQKDVISGKYIQILAPENKVYEKGQSISFKLIKREIPKDAGLVIYLYSASKYQGVKDASIGPMMLRPLAISGTGEETFTWDTKGLGCAPADAPMWCDQISTGGTFYAIAYVYDRNDFSFLGWPSRKVVKKLDESSSNSFQITISQKEVEKNIKDYVSGSISSDVQSLLSSISFPTRNGMKYVHLASEKMTNEGEYCTTYEGLLPLQGTVEYCSKGFKKAISEVQEGARLQDLVSIVKSGELQSSGKVLPYTSAQSMAINVANAPYLSKVAFAKQPDWQDLQKLGYSPSEDFQKWSKEHPFADTYLSSGITNFTYRGEGDGYWIFEIFEIMAGGQEGPGRFADNVFVKIMNNGSSCIVKTIPYNGGSNVNIETDIFSCETPSV